MFYVVTAAHYAFMLIIAVVSYSHISFAFTDLMLLFGCQDYYEAR